MKLVNLLEETLKTIEANGKFEDDILFVLGKEKPSADIEVYDEHLCKNAWCFWSDFKERASTLDYDNFYGDTLISETLKIVGNDWWLERHGFDGSEWWEFKTTPEKPELRSQVMIKRNEIYGDDDD